MDGSTPPRLPLQSHTFRQPDQNTRIFVGVHRGPVGGRLFYPYAFLPSDKLPFVGV